MIRYNNVVNSGGVLETNQQCYIPLEPQENRLKECVNSVSVVRSTEVGQWVEERVSGHSFYKNLLTTSDCQQRVDLLSNFLS